MRPKKRSRALICIGTKPKVVPSAEKIKDWKDFVVQTFQQRNEEVDNWLIMDGMHLTGSRAREADQSNLNVRLVEHLIWLMSFGVVLVSSFKT